MYLRTRWTIGIMAITLMCGGNHVWATNYYVSDSGDDANNGLTAGTAWASPSRGQGVRLNGSHAAGETTINVRDTNGFLSSGSIKLGGSTYSYSSKTATSFSLDSGLGASLGDSTIIQDNSILGGNGFSPGDTIHLNGTFSEPLRFKASGSSGNNITYTSAAGQRAQIRIINRTGSSKGAIWNDGEGASTKSEYVTFDGFDVLVDQNGTGGGPAAGLSGANSITFNDMSLTATGSKGDGSIAFRNVKGSGNAITNSRLRSKYAEGVRGDISGSTTISNSVIWDTRIGLGQINGGTIAADNITIVGGPSSDLWAVHTEGSTVTIDDSIVTGHPTGVWNLSRAALNANASATTGGDYNFLFNLSDNNYYDSDWLAGANDTTGVDAQFLQTTDQSHPHYLRYDKSSPAATAGSGGSWVGAYAPIPEPSSVVLLAVAGITLLGYRRR